MVPSGELHIAAVDYSHTHHPYFCIVKHRCDICTSCWCWLIHGGQSQPWWLWWTAWSSLLLMIMLMLVVDDDDDDRDKDGDVQGLWGQSRESPLPPHSQRWSHLNWALSPKASSSSICDWYWSTMTNSSVCKSGTFSVGSFDWPPFTIVAKAIHHIQIPSLSGNPSLGHVLSCQGLGRNKTSKLSPLFPGGSL